MRKYLLDTTPLAAYLFGRRKAVATIDPWIDNDEVVTSIIVYGEVEEFIKTMTNYSSLHANLRRQLEEIRPLPITSRIMEIYADLRLQMRPPRGPGLISDSDTLIGATAIRYKLTAVTADEKDFKRVPGLKYTLLTTR